VETLVNSAAAREALGLSRTKCTAKTKSTGERCNRWAILGGFVCQVHGGSIPVVKDAAQARLLELADPAIFALRMVALDLASEWERAAALSDDPARVAHFMSLAPSLIRAATVVLDRCGFSPAVKVEVTSNPYSGMSASEMANAAEAFARECRAAADQEAQMQLTDGTSLDGEVVK